MQLREAEKVPIAVFGHPIRTPHMALPREPRSRRFAIRIDVEDGASRFFPIDSGNFSFEKPDIRHEVLLIVRRERIRNGCLIGGVRIKRRLSHLSPSPNNLSSQTKAAPV